MKKYCLILIILLMVSAGIFAQASGGDTPTGGTDTEVGTPTADSIGVDSAQQRLVDVSVTKFEDAGFWYSAMPSDLGFVSIRRRNGEPGAKADLDKDRIDNETSAGAPVGKYVLGVKVKFYKRALSSFSIFPVRPFAIPGKAKTLSMWAIGRNFNHVIKILVEDYHGKIHELTMSKLNFLGWKKLTVAIPPTIVQDDYHFTTRMGIKFIGLKVYCDLMESYGTFYVYFDDLSAVTDLFEEENRDEDDVSDDW